MSFSIIQFEFIGNEEDHNNFSAFLTLNCNQDCMLDSGRR